jgi:hypothetical protein
MMERMEFRRGGLGWALVAIGILIWDLTAPEDQQLTDAWRRANRRGPVSAALVGAAWAVTTAHLYGLIPARFDPLHMIYLSRVALRNEEGDLELVAEELAAGQAPGVVAKARDLGMLQRPLRA